MQTKMSGTIGQNGINIGVWFPLLLLIWMSIEYTGTWQIALRTSINPDESFKYPQKQAKLVHWSNFLI